MLLGRFPLLFYSLQYTYSPLCCPPGYKTSQLISALQPTPAIELPGFVDTQLRNKCKCVRVIKIYTGVTRNRKKSEHSVCMREQPVLLHTDSSRTVSIQMMPKAKRLPCKTTGLCLWDFFMHYHFHLAAVGYKINVYINTVVESKRLF